MSENSQSQEFAKANGQSIREPHYFEKAIYSLCPQMIFFLFPIPQASLGIFCNKKAFLRIRKAFS